MRGLGVRSVAITFAVLCCVWATATAQHLLVWEIAPTVRGMVLPTLLGVGLGALVAYVFATRQRLAEVSNELAALNQQLETKVLARTRELEARSAALLTAQRLEAVGRVAGGVAHDVNNLLTVLNGSAADFRRVALTEDEGERRRLSTSALDDFDEALERIHQLTTQLLALSRAERVQVGPLDLKALLHESLPVLRRLAGERVAVVVAQTPPGPCFVTGSAVTMGQLLMNLVVNARDAMPAGGEVRFSLASDATGVGLEVRDTGQGIAPDDLARIFQPLFTTKAPGKGTGLGLAVVAEVVSQAGGTISVNSQLAVGTTFSVKMPAASR